MHAMDTGFLFNLFIFMDILLFRPVPKGNFWGIVVVVLFKAGCPSVVQNTEVSK